MQDYVIIVAGGVGNRMGEAIPKQFLKLAKKPILMHTIERFASCNPQLKIIVVLHPEYLTLWKEMCAEQNCSVIHQVVEGGEERFYSVKAGLEVIDEENGIVGIHDAVRPFVDFDTIEACYSGARTHCTAIPVLPVFDSIRQIKDGENKAVNRKDFRIVQTPQCFEISLLKEAYSQPYKDSFTDDASVVEALGQKMHLVKGNQENIKITTPSDMWIGEAFLANQRMDC